MRRDARFHNAAVVSLANPGNQAALFHAVKEARHVRVVGDHAVPDGTAGQTFGLGPAEDAKDIVLSARKTRGLQELLCFLSRESAACRRATKMRFSREMERREDLGREYMQRI